MSTGSLPSYLSALVDDAAIFPPGLMPLDAAVAAHRAHLHAEHADLVGPFIVDAARLGDLMDIVSDEPIIVSVVVSALDAETVLSSTLGTPVHIAAIEAKLDPAVDVRLQLDRLVDVVARHPETRVFVEAPRPGDARWNDVLHSAARGSLSLKFRTGGTESATFPSDSEVSEWIDSAVARGIPFKCTAGLHNAVRHTDGTTAFDHHGYLNILGATAVAARGEDPLRLVGERDQTALVEVLRGLGDAALRRARTFFVSYGSCSISEPYEDLGGLGLVHTSDEAQPGERETWVPGARGSGFDIDHLPYGVFRSSERSWRPGIRVANAILDLRAAAQQASPRWSHLFSAGSLDALLGAGAETWRGVREWATDVLTDPAFSDRDLLVPLQDAELRLPFTVGDYVDFYASIDHASNVGRIFRPDGDALLPNWRHMPVSYHGRGGSIVASGEDVTRPLGQRKRPADAEPDFGPTRQLDIEAELGFVIGRATRIGQRVTPHEFSRSVFGVVGLNDWSARDIQAWEYVPLGPHLGKSFLTTISAWVTPLAALESARTSLPDQVPAPLDHLRLTEPGGFDIAIEVIVNGQTVAYPPYACMYWGPAQMLAHMTSNGASLHAGDIFGSGTISGPEEHQRGSLLELSWGASTSWREGDSAACFLLDGDEVTLRYTARGQRGPIILGEVSGRVVPAH